MRTFHVRKGEEAVIIAGADKGKRGRIIAVLAKKQRVIVEGAHMIKKHMRKSQQYPQGQIVEREGSIHHLQCDEGRGIRRASRAACSAGSAPPRPERACDQDCDPDFHLSKRSGKIRKTAK